VSYLCCFKYLYFEMLMSFFSESSFLIRFFFILDSTQIEENMLSNEHTLCKCHSCFVGIVNILHVALRNRSSFLMFFVSYVLRFLRSSLIGEPFSARSSAENRSRPIAIVLVAVLSAFVRILFTGRVSKRSNAASNDKSFLSA